MDIPLTLSIVALVFATVPFVFFLLNRAVYRAPRRVAADAPLPGVSVLIPARNEAANIHAALDSVLSSPLARLEVIVLDDQSSDNTAEIVRMVARKDSRVRLEPAPPLPAGWCGKQHACHHLAGLAQFPYLIFMDADVRLAADAPARMVHFMESNQADSPRLNENGYCGPVALASGVPHQQTGTFLERLLIPLIHFLLMSYLPMRGMRNSCRLSTAAGCGQLFIARADAYRKAGGHAAIRATLHDGVKLPRAFRRAGFMTGLFDATDLATCRMYHGAGETWRGLGKNAVEGLAAPRLIGVMTLMLFCGQVLPWLILPFASGLALGFAGASGLLSLAPRLAGAAQFRQAPTGVLLHPVSIVLLLVIQWQAFFRWLMGRPNSWKGRSYTIVEPASPPKIRPTEARA
ncbi:MAG TPA: glycosyl transferase [Verrucomicrobiales bacterium]|nr:glycosyl transferase [Verrucomicrobiales bacterium]